MANTTIYPYGLSGEIPAGLPVVNDLTTGGANKALSAEQGKVLNGMINPGVDSSYTQGTYSGPRLTVKDSQIFGIKMFGTKGANQQSMDAFGNTLVCMVNGSTHYIYSISSNGSVVQLATFSASTGHSNSIQFAPFMESGQDFPYLYVATLSKSCKVLSITSAYAVSVVQTISVDSSLIAAGSGDNTQIGDDGYIWTMFQESDERYHFIKFRRVAVSEGDVTLTSADILDEWTTEKAYPYATNVWQGMKIKDGRLWFVIGSTGGSQARCILVFDTATHALVTTIDLATVNEEFENLCFWDDAVLVSAWSANIYKLVL